MSSFLVFHEKPSIGPSFNEAATILKANKDLTVYNTLDALEVFVVEMPESARTQVESALPGWKTEPNGIVRAY